MTNVEQDSLRIRRRGREGGLFQEVRGEEEERIGENVGYAREEEEKDEQKKSLTRMLQGWK